MNHNKRSLLAVLVSGFIVQILGSAVPWWSFIILLGFIYLVVDAALEAVAERRSTR